MLWIGKTNPISASTSVTIQGSQFSVLCNSDDGIWGDRMTTHHPKWKLLSLVVEAVVEALETELLHS